MNKITPSLWFDDEPEAAAEFYCSVFPHAKKVNEMRVCDAGPGAIGSLLTVDLELKGSRLRL